MTDLDKTLLEEIRNGNLKSFELVFKGYYPRLCKYAYSLVNNFDAASDLVKDIFTKWWENQNNIIINTSLSSYLYRSVHNNCINYLTRIVPKQKIINESDLGMPIKELIFPVSADYPLANLVAAELENTIEKAIQNLPEHCREIFILSRVEQLSHKEIAKKLDISENTVKVQIYRALLKLRSELKDYLPIISFLILQKVS